MPWLQTYLTTSKERAPLVELLFENLGALSVTLGDAEDEPLLEPPPGESPLWQKTRVTGLFDGATDPDMLRMEIMRSLKGEGCDSLELEVIEDQAWERAWMDAFQPMQFGNRLWICPNGQQAGSRDAVVVELDPGLAFGTGTHPTTALCLEWLDTLDPADQTVIDFGCGSGILAVAALKLGASRAIAIDHDPQALEATAANAKKNCVSDRIEILGSEESPDGRADILVANILAGTLIELEPVIAAHIKPGGRLALSGILAEQAQEVSDAYCADFTMEPPKQLEDWVLISGIRNSN